MSRRERLAVTAIDCTGCKETILRTLRSLDGVHRMTADHSTGAVELLVGDDVATADLEATLQRLGYRVGT
ncbi:copper chaperone [Halogranum amylolyticum]|uniref:Copper chaperone n=1 Tax=Halogranum amylolyticum TaxID=660520 RepID=A0A1H8PBJ7_9EURY|nr:copper chaperone [Halogranum amylolyticum]